MLVLFYSSVPNFSVAESRGGMAEADGEITNVASGFLPLGDGEKRLILNGNKIVSAVEKYFRENGDYPSSHEVLGPDYMGKIPKTGYKRTYL